MIHLFSVALFFIFNPWNRTKSPPNFLFPIFLASFEKMKNQVAGRRTPHKPNAPMPDKGTKNMAIMYPLGQVVNLQKMKRRFIFLLSFYQLHFYWMKYLFPLLLLLFGCVSHQSDTISTTNPKDTVIQTVWTIEDGDTVTGYAIHVNGSDTIIEDFGVNPSWNPKK